MPGISATSEEEDRVSTPGICKGTKTEEEGGGLGSIPGICNRLRDRRGLKSRKKEMCAIDMIELLYKDFEPKNF
jgi:hypothetical protein